MAVDVRVVGVQTSPKPAHSAYQSWLVAEAPDVRAGGAASASYARTDYRGPTLVSDYTRDAATVAKLAIYRAKSSPDRVNVKLATDGCGLGQRDDLDVAGVSGIHDDYLLVAIKVPLPCQYSPLGSPHVGPEHSVATLYGVYGTTIGEP
jgi:hypothetical protein